MDLMYSSTMALPSKCSTPVILLSVTLSEISYLVFSTKIRTRTLRYMRKTTPDEVLNIELLQQSANCRHI
jgi:hypothetical protein